MQKTAVERHSPWNTPCVTESKEREPRVLGSRREVWVGFQKRDIMGARCGTKERSAWRALCRKTAPKAFLMSVAMKTWLRRATARDLRLYTILSAPEDRRAPYWYSPTARMMLCLDTSRARPVATLRRVSNMVIGLTPSPDFLLSGLTKPLVQISTASSGTVPEAQASAQSLTASVPYGAFKRAKR